MTTAAATYERIRAACGDEHGLHTSDALDRHAASITETVLDRQGLIPWQVIHEAEAGRFAHQTNADPLPMEGSIS